MQEAVGSSPIIRFFRKLNIPAKHRFWGLKRRVIDVLFIPGSSRRLQPDLLLSSRSRVGPVVARMVVATNALWSCTRARDVLEVSGSLSANRGHRA